MKSLSAPLFDIRKSFFLRTEMDRLLTSSMCFSCMLEVVRIVHSGRLLFIFMIWNLFLAYIPYALSTWLTARYSISDGRWPEVSGTRLPEANGTRLSLTRRRGSQILLIVLSLVCLLFIPNT